MEFAISYTQKHTVFLQLMRELRNVNANSAWLCVKRYAV